MLGGVRAEPKTVTARPIPRERVKAHRELLCDVAYPLGVGGANLRRLVAEPQQELLVEGGGWSVRAADRGATRCASYAACGAPRERVR